MHLFTVMRVESREPIKRRARKQSAFGEFLVEQKVIDRFQLFRALQMQDRAPGTRLGQCAVALGYAAKAAIEELHVRFAAIDRDVDLTIDHDADLTLDRDVTLDNIKTEAFHREPEIEVIES